MIVESSYNVKDSDDDMKQNFCSTNIPLYKTEDMSDEQINGAKEFLESQEWNDVNKKKLIMILEEMVTKYCDLRNPPKKTRGGSDFKSKNKIPRIVRKWMRKKNLASKAIKK